MKSGPKPLFGESPHWDAATQSLYYIDLFDNKTGLYRYDFATNRIYSAGIPNEESMPGFILPIDGRKDTFIVGLDHDIKVIKWDGVSPTVQSECTQITVNADIKTNRLHDTHVDPYGNLYCGLSRLSFCDTESKAASGRVYKSTDGKTAEVIFNDVNAPNTLVWNTEKNKVYFSDTCRNQVREYDWDPETTALCMNSLTLHHLI